MIASLRDKPSQEDELTSKAVPATMYIGMPSPFVALFDADENRTMRSHQVEPIQSVRHIFSDLDNNLI